MHRTHNCGELRLSSAGQTVTLSGWLSNIRDKGAIVFITLRDHYGVTQAVITDDALKNAIREIPRESVIQITGKVVERSDVNKDMPTGQIEVVPEKIEILGKCMELLPFEIASSKENHDDLRLKYRYLDLRNPLVHNNIIFRSKVIQKIRELMVEQGFMEIQTPILTSSSPEGARDYIVPSRLNPGKFYALPQAPQQFKQLLMLSGFDKYFQIAPCFRDEDARADRSPGEFYQLDVEMAFAEQEDVFGILENVLYRLFSEFTNFSISKPPFTRIPFADAMNDYGSDKPDLRNPLKIKDITSVFASSEFKAFQNQTLKALIVSGAAGSPRKLFDRLTSEIVADGAKGLVWLKVLSDGTLNGSAAKFINEDEVKALTKQMNAKADDVIFIIADENEKALKLSGLLRNKLGREFQLIDESTFQFCWIVDFPMFEKNVDTGDIEFSHNPFSMPQGGMDALKNKDPLDILAYQYDIVCNGTELSSGAVRNHDPEIMIEAFRIAGYTKEVVESKFPALFNAFKYGAPPHAGIAPGVDRIVMLLANEPNIREVIAFPMNKNAQDLLMNAPSEITEKQLSDVHIQLKQSTTLL